MSFCIFETFMGEDTFEAFPVTLLCLVRTRRKVESQPPNAYRNKICTVTDVPVADSGRY